MRHANGCSCAARRRQSARPVLRRDSPGQARPARGHRPLLAMLATTTTASRTCAMPAVMGLAGSPADAEARLELRKILRPPCGWACCWPCGGSRPQKSPTFLNDPDPRLVVEAARAIHDVPIEAALPKLAALDRPRRLDRRRPAPPGDQRQLSRPGRLSTRRLIAATPRAAKSRRRCGWKLWRCWTDWAKPSGRDRVLGLWRPLAGSRPADAAEALRVGLAASFQGSDGVRSRAGQVAAIWASGSRSPMPCTGCSADSAAPQKPEPKRLPALGALEDPGRRERRAGGHRTTTARWLRIEPRNALLASPADADACRLKAGPRSGERIERQAAMEPSGDITDTAGEPTRSSRQALDRIPAGELPAEPGSTCSRRPRSDGRRSRSRRSCAKIEARPPLTIRWRPIRMLWKVAMRTVASGFSSSEAEVSCVRCHKIDGTGGDVGPELTKIAVENKTRLSAGGDRAPNKSRQGIRNGRDSRHRRPSAHGNHQAGGRSEGHLMTAEGQAGDGAEGQHRGPQSGQKVDAGRSHQVPF